MHRLKGSLLLALALAGTMGCLSKVAHFRDPATSAVEACNFKCDASCLHPFAWIVMWKPALDYADCKTRYEEQGWTRIEGTSVDPCGPKGK